MTILLLDDELVVLNGITKMIHSSHSDYDIKAFLYAPHAVDYCKNNKVDIIISDIQMPDMDGLSFCRTIEAVSDAKIIIISGYDSFDYAKEAIELGAFRYILKPIRQKELMDAVEEAIEKLTDERNIIKNAQLYTSSSLAQLLSDQNIDKDSTDFIKKLDDLLASHISDITLETAAESFGFNPSYFSVRFKKITGINFKEYLINYKIDCAKQLLESTNRTISDIAFTLGYQSVDHFSKTFHNKVGLNPSDFRKNK